MTTLMVLLALFGCNRSDAVVEALEGSWNMSRIDLYKDDALNGTTSTGDEPVIYNFQKTGKITELIITQDNVTEKYVYDYDHQSKTLWLSSQKQFTIEEITAEKLVLANSYNPYKSVYTFERIL